MSTNIKVSIIMPVYNSGKFLHTAVDSILNQSLKEIELILVDDGSTDGSDKRCDEYAQKDNRVIVLHQKNGGICNARNNALKIARGEYIGFSDHDDEYVSGYLEEVYNKGIAENADIVKVENKGIFLQDGVKYKEEQTHFDNRKYFSEDIRIEFFPLIRMNALTCVWDGIYRRSMIDDNCIHFNETYKHGGEDIDFMLKLVGCAKILITIDKVYYLHYLRKGFSTSSKFHVDMLPIFDVRFATLNDTIKRLNIPFNTIEKDYTVYFMKEYVTNYLRYLSNKHCTLPWKNKKKTIKELYKKPFFYPFVLNQKISDLCKISKVYGFIFFFFKHHYFLPNYLIYKFFKKQ
jgi:glycosyltransferase involved in cell wall biosynthesis